MIGNQPITFLNTGLPVAVLAMAAWLVPLWLGRASRDQRALMWAVLTAGMVIMAAGAVIFALIYGVGGIPVLTAIFDSPIAVAAFFAKLSMQSGIVWVPILALTWFILAQGVEKRKGQRQAQGEAS